MKPGEIGGFPGTLIADREEYALSKGSNEGGDSVAANKVSNRATDTDRFVGSRIRDRRIMLGLSQQQMAEMIGVTYQQAHKYERGINRISTGRLFEISQVLGVSVGFFYEGLESDSGEELKYRQRMCLEVARNFTQIDNKIHQEALSHLARALAVK